MTPKKKIVIIEDDYSQYSIIRELLYADFEIRNLNKTEFNKLTAKLMRFLNSKDSGNNYSTAMGNFKDVSAFIVDYELKEESNKTGVLFCQLTEQINSGKIPVLFLSKIDITNIIADLNLTDMKFSQLRKRDYWSDETLNIEDRVNKSTHERFKIQIIEQLNHLIKTYQSNGFSEDHINKLNQ